MLPHSIRIERRQRLRGARADSCVYQTGDSRRGHTPQSLRLDSRRRVQPATQSVHAVPRPCVAWPASQPTPTCGSSTKPTGGPAATNDTFARKPPKPQARCAAPAAPAGAQKRHFCDSGFQSERYLQHLCEPGSQCEWCVQHFCEPGRQSGRYLRHFSDLRWQK